MGRKKKRVVIREIQRVIIDCEQGFAEISVLENFYETIKQWYVPLCSKRFLTSLIKEMIDYIRNGEKKKYEPFGPPYDSWYASDEDDRAYKFVSIEIDCDRCKVYIDDGKDDLAPLIEWKYYPCNEEGLIYQLQQLIDLVRCGTAPCPDRERAEESEETQE